MIDTILMSVELEAAFSCKELERTLKLHVQHPAMAIHWTKLLYGSVTDCPWITTVLYLSGTYMD